jgi:hypothetical protein
MILINPRLRDVLSLMVLSCWDMLTKPRRICPLCGLCTFDYLGQSYSAIPNVIPSFAPALTSLAAIVDRALVTFKAVKR